MTQFGSRAYLIAPTVVPGLARNTDQLARLLRSDRAPLKALQRVLEPDHENISWCHEVSLEVGQGEVVGLIGPSGWGKPVPAIMDLCARRDVVFDCGHVAEYEAVVLWRRRSAAV